MNKKITAAIIAACSCFSISASAFASEVPDNQPTSSYQQTQNTEQKLKINSIVPQEYIDKYEGQFASFDEVFAYFGGHNEKTELSDDSDDSTIKAETPAELAGLLDYINEKNHDNEVITLQPISTQQISNNESITTYASSSTDFGEPLYEWYVGGVWGFVTLTYDSTTLHITKTTPTSSIIGVSATHSWEPNKPTITVLNNRGRDVKFTGSVTFKIDAGGIGNIWTDYVSKTMRCYSGPVLGPVE